MQEYFEKMADIRIEKVMEFYKNENNDMVLYLALMGDSFWKLEVTPGAGHNYYYIIEAIYRYYLKNPEDRIDEYFSNTIKHMAKHSFSLRDITNFLNIVIAELDNEKQKISPFKINVVEILKIFSERLKIEPKLYNEGDIIEKVGEYDGYLNQNHGYKVL